MIDSKITNVLAIACLLTLASSFQMQAQALPTALPNPNDPVVFNATKPPSTGRPGRRSDAGSRGCGDDVGLNSSEAKPLLALVPTQTVENSTMVFGRTTTKHPTFWFYVPYHPSLTAIFVLQDQEGNSLYQADVPLPQKAGILGVTLPTTVAPLVPGKPYHWFFKLYCRPSSPPTSFVDGWVLREPVTTDLAQQLKTATPAQQIRLYAANGFWFDALTTAAELQLTDPKDFAWVELLEAIELEQVADETVVKP